MAGRLIDREYEAELDKLRELVLLMGARVEEMMIQATRAFDENSSTRASATIEVDSTVDRLELEIDEACLKILARRQPVASDLRFITTTMKLVTDLERIGDLCVNLCERVVEFADEPSTEGTTPIPKIAQAAHGMLHDALDAFVARDVAKAEDVLDRDKIVDAYYAQLFPELVARMMADPRAVFRSTRLLSIGKYLERIADHATNIAEMVVFMVRGDDVRHSGPSHPPNA
ncbi:MAG TPA: phosphate signaling complex protein PhoU [Polyangiaceae bacterium]|jgi:phosphate transport system protein|nr:phosphate signaling complex protein PhoU [Polyangiaceae bacterium]